MVKFSHAKQITFQAESPSAGQITALGVYLLASLFFVVIGLMEFACVLYLHQYNERHLTIPFESYQRKMNHVNQSQNDNGSMVYLNGKPTFDILAIDRLAFAVVGTFFLLFNWRYRL